MNRKTHKGRCPVMGHCLRVFFTGSSGPKLSTMRRCSFLFCTSAAKPTVFGTSLLNAVKVMNGGYIIAAIMILGLSCPCFAVEQREGTQNSADPYWWNAIGWAIWGSLAFFTICHALGWRLGWKARGVYPLDAGVRAFLFFLVLIVFLFSDFNKVHILWLVGLSCFLGHLVVTRRIPILSRGTILATSLLLFPFIIGVGRRRVTAAELERYALPGPDREYYVVLDEAHVVTTLEQSEEEESTEAETEPERITVDVTICPSCGSALELGASVCCVCGDGPV